MEPILNDGCLLKILLGVLLMAVAIVGWGVSELCRVARRIEDHLRKP